MKSEEFVRSALPSVRVIARPGFYIGGRLRTEIYYGKQLIGCDTRPRCAWAEAARWVKETRKEPT